METKAQMHERLIRQFLLLRNNIHLRKEVNEDTSEYLDMLDLSLKIFIENELQENGVDLPNNVYFDLMKENSNLAKKYE